MIREEFSPMDISILESNAFHLQLQYMVADKRKHFQSVYSVCRGHMKSQIVI